MKRVIAFAFVLILCSCGFAENDYLGTPKSFVEEHGLIVFSGDDLAKYGIDVDKNKSESDYSFCAFEISGNTGIIGWYQPNAKTRYAAVDFSSLLSNGRAGDVALLAKTYADFCRTFDFDLYYYTNGVNAVSCIPEVNMELAKIAINMKQDVHNLITPHIEDLIDAMKDSLL